MIEYIYPSYVYPILEKKTVENFDGRKSHHHFVIVFCPICFKGFKMSRRKRGKVKGKKILNSKGKYLIPEHFGNEWCAGSRCIVS